MAIALVNDDVTNSIPRRVNGNDATSWTTDLGGPSNTGSFTPAANSLLLCFMQSDNSGTSFEDPTSVSGNGVSYNKVATQDFSGYGQIHLWAADSGSSPSAGTVNATWTNARIGNCMYILEFSGCDLTSGAVAAIVQTVGVNNGGSVTSQQITLAAAGNAGNRSVSGFGHTVNEGTNPDADAGTWVEIHDQSHANPARAWMVQWRSDAFDTDHDASWTTANPCIGMAFEIRVAGAGGGTVVSDAYGMSGVYGT